MAFTAGMNPLKSVGGKTVKCPSQYKWEQIDVSASDAGRTEDGLMHKKKIRTVDGITLEWAYPTTIELKAILAAFSAEYISITYLSPTAGDFVTKTFYVGDRSSPMYNSTLNRWENVSFKIVER
ncbi:MAG: DUF6711 family protein [Acutalibacteraceae bacterium]|jgi:hypothetical protein|nr:hypothetical protein [Ruminococcus sp.]DAR74055.1 MAG TPA: hypothetical protein [Caudoviricetes sp.]